MKALKKDKIQKTIYILGLLMLILLAFQNGVKTLNQKSSLGVEYWYVFIVPCVILVYQIIFNNKIGWLSMMLLYSFYLLWYLRNAFIGIKEKVGYWGTNDYIMLIVILWILILLGVFLYVIKPGNGSNRGDAPNTEFSR